MKILITGSSGKIGTILAAGLNHDVSCYDLPEADILNFDQLVRSFMNHDTIIHLAWKTDTDNYTSNFHDSENSQMAFNVYQAAVEAGVRRVIMASSIHASMRLSESDTSLIDPLAIPYPDSPYGAGKVFMEALGRYYANYKHLEVICLRFGSVGWGKPDLSDPEHRFWLSDNDCISLVEHCLRAEQINDSYCTINAVSDNKGRIHSLVNQFGWIPSDGIS